MQKWHATRWVTEGNSGTKIMMRVIELSNAENFLTKVIWEMTNFNIKNSGELDYEK